MELIPLTPDNIPKAEQYLNSIGKLQEFRDKKIEPAQWSAIIIFANQLIQNNGGANTNPNNQ